jgi:hypothetical protein
VRSRRRRSRSEIIALRISRRPTVPLLRRRALLAAVASFLATTAIPKAEAVIQGTWFAGCFYDPAAAPTSQIFRYLVAPERLRIGKMPSESFGEELTQLGQDALKGEIAFVQAARLGSDDSSGDPLFLGISRAMHEVLKIREEGLPDEYVTVISITATVDIATDRAAEANAKRFESLYSCMLVTNQVIQDRRPLTDAELITHYRRIALEALKGALERSTKDLSDQRSNAPAAFQISAFQLPDPIPPEVIQLLQTATQSDATTDVDQEKGRLSRELQHILSFAVEDELARRGRRDIAILPPPSPWADGRVLHKLKLRYRLSDQEMLRSPDPSRMNGYEIRAALIGTHSKAIKTTTVGALVQISTQIADRIVQNKSGSIIPVPSSIADPARKIGVGWGYRNYGQIAGIERGATRDVAMGSLRDACIDLARPTVDLMLTTAREIN